ncbi:transglycosylase SLT domain-containing protein [Spirochaetia bacterium 38H-sp]|uniref:Transglycosylase SLT domain-containing protein n=1 Tax=Rarispira pelagica TaxID=3141764 RepID=A0ABU9U8Q2_9SPIR
MQYTQSYVKLFLILLTLAIISCAEFPVNTLSGQWIPIDNKNVVEEKRQEAVRGLLALAKKSKSPALFLYRQEESRDFVMDFFTNLTGSRDIALPILYYSDKYNVPLFVSFSLSYIESEYYPYAINENVSSIDRGLFQLNSKTFPYLEEDDFFNPDINAKYGIQHISYCLREAKSEVLALAYYNAGKYRVVTGGTPAMTLRYIEKYFTFKNKLEEKFFSYMNSVADVSSNNIEKYFKSYNGELKPVDTNKTTQ